LAVEESLGGGGGLPRLLYAAIEEAAKALAPVPLVPTVTALGVAVQVGAKELIERITAGSPAAFAVPLDDGGWLTTGLELPEWDGSRLTGAVPVVAGAPAADVLLVLARTADATEEVLLAVDPAGDSDHNVQVVAHQPLDLTATVGAVAFERASAEVIADGDELRDGVRNARRQALLAVAADSVGVGSRALAMAVAWAGEREQFGRPIGSFQAISHRCADMLVALEGARSQVLNAAENDVNAADSEYLVDLAAAAAFDAAVFATEGAIQIHGGVGFTWEHPAHVLLRRAQANAVLVGRAESLRDRAARDVTSAFRKRTLER